MAEIKYLKEKQEIIKVMSEYVDYGLPIIPLCSADHEGMSPQHIKRCSKPGKVPLIKGWQNWSETSEETLQEWLNQFGYTNVGLPLGDASGYVGIDIDGSYGEKTLEELSGGDIPDTWEYTTGDGRRLLYQIPVGMKTKKFKNASSTEAHSECSFLCTGQETVLPPSIHHTGRIYKWKPNHSPFDRDCTMAPQWLVNLIRLDTKVPTLSLKINKNQEEILKEQKKLNLYDSSVLELEFTQINNTFDGNLPDDVVSPETVKVRANYKVDIPLTEISLTEDIPDGQRDDTMTRIIGSFCAKYRALGKDRITILAIDHNQRYCKPPLEEQAIIDKVNHLWELEQMKNNCFRDKAESKASFEPNLIATTILNVWEEDGLCMEIQDDADTLWYCHRNEGPWKSVSCRSSNFFSMFSDIMSNPKYGGQGSWTTTQRLKDVATQIVVQLRKDGRIWNSDVGNIDTQSISDCSYIPLRGGQLLNWKTEEIIAWSPKFHFTYTLPLGYNPEATCPYWEARMAEWLPDEGSRLVLQEFVGYSLIPYMGFEKSILLIGEGANGKSIFLESIQSLLGTEVVGSLSMKNIFSKFGAANLQGKILNICNEAGSEYLRNGNADEFKNLVSGGRILADVKNQPHVAFNNTAKFLFSANHDIKTNDKSAGWTRRLLIIPFEQNFGNSGVPKTELMTNIRKEYEGIFTWAVKGLQRLMLNGEFSNSKAIDKKVQEYAAENNIAKDFFNNCLQVFDIENYEVDGKKGMWGTPTKLVNDLFTMWVEHKESSIQKPKKYIKEFLEKKQLLKTKRTANVLHTKQKQTTCWIGLTVNIRDTEFLELMLDEGDLIQREIAMKSLRQVDNKIA